MMNKPKIVVVLGPTASGKTKLAVDIALKYNGEVVSADSMQIYKQMDIASAKPSEDEMRGVVHHLIDCKDVSQRYSVAEFVSDAKEICNDIISRKKLPVICGGTGLYIDSFINNISFSTEDFSEDVRASLNSRLEKEGIESLYNELVSIDEEYALKVDKNNPKRVLRALELYLNTGKTMTDQLEKSTLKPSEYDFLLIGLNYSDRNLLYERINKRVDKMLSDGLIGEAESFYKNIGIKTANQAIGIKELKPYLDSEISIENATERIKQETRRYAKRQITWFKRNIDIHWIYADETEDIFVSSCELIDSFLNEG